MPASGFEIQLLFDGAIISMENTVQPQIIKGNPRRCVFLVAIAVALVLASEKWFFPWLNEFSERAHCEEILGFNGADVLFASLFIGLPLVFLVITVWFAFVSLRILTTGQMPPPGSWVCRDTVPKSGRSVIWRACLGLTFPAIGIAFLVWGILAFFDLKKNLLEPERDRMSRTCIMRDSNFPNRSLRMGTGHRVRTPGNHS